MQQNINSVSYGASAIVQMDDKYLLIKRGNPPAKDMYAFPGGRRDGEEELSQTAIRELKEETGLIGQSPKLYAQYIAGSPNKQFELSVFKVEVAQKHGAKAADDAAGLGWFTIKEAFELPLPENMKDCLQKLSMDSK